jgi:outer membrane lipoprotein LolB
VKAFRSHRWLIGVLLALPLGLLGGCAAPPVTALTNTPWPARQVALAKLQTWRLAGRLALTSGEQGWHASLYWQQQADDYRIELVGPLGQGRLRIQGAASGVSVQTADGQVRTADDPDRLLAETSGVHLPLKGLLYWVRGLPDPAQPAVLAGDAEGRLTRLEQAGWTIEYLDYRPVAALTLPVRLRAYRDEVNVQIIIQTWDLQPEASVLSRSG